MAQLWVGDGPLVALGLQALLPLKPGQVVEAAQVEGLRLLAMAP